MVGLSASPPSSPGFAGTIAGATVCLQKEEQPFPAPALGAGYLHSGWSAILLQYSCNSCARHLAQSGPDVHDRQSRRVCSAKGSRCHKPLGGEDGLGLPIRYHQGWVCRADGDRAAVVSSHSPVVRIRCKESICSVCQYDLISYSMFSREALSP